MDSAVVGCVSKGYTAPAPVPSPTGTASPLALFTLAALSSRTLNIAVTTTKGLGDAPITRHVALDVVTATLKVQVGCRWRNRKRLLLLLLSCCRCCFRTLMLPHCPTAALVASIVRVLRITHPEYEQT